jgi:homocysteine S-methyltransferase
MRTAVRLARDAKLRFSSERPDARPETVQVALSLGPYGATLSANEFDGMYPPPYGPPLGPGGQQRNTFRPGEEALEENSVEALVQFHLERLRVFAADEETWKAIDWVAFETMPLRREMLAVRRAMAVLQSELAARHGGGREKKWWISTVHPSGVFPERSCCGEAGCDGCAPVSAVDIVGAMFHPGLPAPDGIGINCTGVAYLGKLLAETTAAVGEVHDRRKLCLVLYPNGMDWDREGQKWISVGSSEDAAAGWASAVAEAVRPYAQGNIWDGIIVGGCCKSGPGEIAALASAVATAR